MATQTAITINGQTLPVREYQGQRVVTVQDVAMVHDTKEDQIRRNFNRNRKHFIEGVDYFNIKGKKARVNLSSGSKFITQINVFTESGYLMLAKSLTDDLAWQVQRELVNRYFKLVKSHAVEMHGRETHGVEMHCRASVQRDGGNSHLQITTLFDLLDESYKKVIYYRLEKGLTQDETAKILEISKSKLKEMEQNLKNAGMPLPRQIHNLGKYTLRNYKALSQALEG